MLLLVAFALVAGAATAITPCVLPVLPAVLSATGTGGRRRPLGVVAGLALTFFVTIVGFASVADGVGLGDGTLRSIAIVVLMGFGATLLVPALGHRLEERLAAFSRLGPRSAGDGFWSGIGVGGALGFVYAPCAGPILAGVISVSASRGATAQLIVVAAAYAIGSAATLLLIALGGRRVLDRIRRAGRGPTVQRALGVLMVGTAIAMAFSLDVRFQTALANHFPSVISNPTGSLERSNAVEKRLRALRGRSRFDTATAQAKPMPAARTASSSGLPDLGAAPDFTGNQRWFNTPRDKPLSLHESLRGRVVLVDFWTYTCINCIRTLPFLRRLDARYRSQGLTIVGVHTPEFDFEHDAGNVKAAIAQNRLRYPVAQDNDYATWNAYGNQFWPAEYLIDARGHVRHTHFGEGEYDQTEAAVRSLLREAGATKLAAHTSGKIELPSTGQITPETYLGTARAERILPQAPLRGAHDYKPVRPPQLSRDHFTLGGSWDVGPEAATALGGGTIDAIVNAKKIYLVLSSGGSKPRPVRVFLDGRRAGTVTVRGQRLYQLAALPRPETKLLRLELASGVSAYAFTFG